MDVNREMCTCGGAAQLLGDSLELGFTSAERGFAAAEDLDTGSRSLVVKMGFGRLTSCKQQSRLDQHVSVNPICRRFLIST